MNGIRAMSFSRLREAKIMAISVGAHETAEAVQREIARRLSRVLVLSSRDKVA